MFYNILQYVKIIEYGSLVSAPFCGKILADLGAEVIKIEDPNTGDESRRQKPLLRDKPGIQASGLYRYLNTNKLGITLSLSSDKGRKILAELLAGSDVFIENMPCKKEESLGITYEFVKSIKPGIIMTSITPFGQTGPYRDFRGGELINAHMGGIGYASTREVRPEKEPIKLPARVLSFQAGLSAAAVTMGAIYRNKLSGTGAYIDISEQESALQNLAIPLARYAYADQIVSRTDLLDRAPFHILPCKDGYIYHAFVHEYQWDRFIELMGRPDWAKNELFKDYETRGKYWDALKPLMTEWTMQHTMEEIYRKSQEKGAPIGAVYTAKEILASSQLQTRDFFVQFEGRGNESIKYPGVPYTFSGLTKHNPEAAPTLGQHNRQIYYERLGYTMAALEELKKDGII